MMRVTVAWLFCVLFILTGFQQGNDVPTKIEKIDLKLLDDEVAFTFLNLTNGEATLMQNAQGEAILINTGHLDTKSELKNYLNLYGITSINKIILTKIGPDYDGNLGWLLSEYSVKKVIVPSSVKKEDIKVPLVPLEKWAVGTKVESLFGSSINVVQIIGSENAMNFTLKYGEHRFLFMSVASQALETDLIKQHPLKDVNILKVAEFANNNGTSQRLLDAVDPQVAIIFSKKNSYPSADVLERLQSTWIDIYYTKQFGNITVKCNKENYEVITITVQSIKGM
jgi:beta-lactamase superfamily II metal-dependent hydrolase